MLTAEAVAAEVEILGASAPGGILEARVVRMYQGDAAATHIRLQPEAVTSCDVRPEPGERGVVIGALRSSSNGLLVIDPVRTRWSADRGAEVPRPSDGPAPVTLRPPLASPRF